MEKEPNASQQSQEDVDSSYYLIVVAPFKPDADKPPPETSVPTLSINSDQTESADPLEEVKDQNPVPETDQTHKNNEGQCETQPESTPGPTSTQKTDGEPEDTLEKVKNTCPYCGKHFSSALVVEDHVTYVHRKPYKCDNCNKAFKTVRALEKHKKCHQPDYFFKCDICNQKFKNNYNMRRHQRRVHSEDDESKFMCEHCGRGFKVKTDLTIHVKKAHIMEPQVCRFCGKTVINVSSHEWKHRKRNKELKYEHACHLCDKKFRQRIILDNHLRLHEEGFKCEECGQTHRNDRELINHRKLKHRQKKSYLCTICQKTFACTSNFYQHVLTHAGVRPYKCDICEEDFTQRSSMLRHRRQHPGPLPPLQWTPPHVAEVAKSYLQNMGDQKNSNEKDAKL